MKSRNLPCITCPTFAICKIKYDEVYFNQKIIKLTVFARAHAHSRLSRDCELLAKWIGSSVPFDSPIYKNNRYAEIHRVFLKEEMTS